MITVTSPLTHPVLHCEIRKEALDSSPSTHDQSECPAIIRQSGAATLIKLLVATACLANLMGGPPLTLAQTPATPSTLQVRTFPGLTIAGASRSNVEIQFSPSLAEPIHWEVLTRVSLLDSPYEFVDHEAPAAGQRYYRVVEMNGRRIGVHPGPGTPIQDAVNAATAGDTIEIGEGSYAEQVVISGKTLTLEGLGAAILQPPSKMVAVNNRRSILLAQNGASVTIKNLNFDGMSLGGLAQGKFMGLTGAYFRGAAGEVLQCSFRNFVSEQICEDAFPFCMAIRADGGASALVRESLFRHNRRAIFAGFGAVKLEALANFIDGDGVGVSGILSLVVPAHIEGNSITGMKVADIASGPGVGIVVSSAAGAPLPHRVLQNFLFQNNLGIAVDGCDKTTSVAQNTIIGPGVADNTANSILCTPGPGAPLPKSVPTAGIDLANASKPSLNGNIIESVGTKISGL